MGLVELHVGRVGVELLPVVGLLVVVDVVKLPVLLVEPVEQPELLAERLVVQLECQIELSIIFLKISYQIYSYIIL